MNSELSWADFSKSNFLAIKGMCQIDEILFFIKIMCQLEEILVFIKIQSNFKLFV